MASETVNAAKPKRGRYRKPGHKEVTTRMPVDLVEAVRQAAREQNLSISDYMIAAAERATRSSHDCTADVARAHARQALQAALAQLEHEEELPASA